MAKWAVSLKGSKPLLCQSKLVGFSLFYLFTSAFLALYTSVFSTNCLSRSSSSSSPFDPIQHSLFTYPSSYGEHKYAIPTHRSSCHSPVYFSDYATVTNDLEESCRNSRELGSGNVRYMQGDAESFGGNFSSGERFSYFNRAGNATEIPCGFLKKLPVSYNDAAAMERCDGVVVVSAIFGDHDKIRQPKGVGAKTLDSVCFFMFVDDVTLGKLREALPVPEKSIKIGAWRMVRVGGEDLYEDPAMNGVVYKHLIHRLFPRSKYSIWVDAKLQLVVDPLLLIHALVVKEGVDMAISKHPVFRHTMEEAVATARWKKWSDVQALSAQMDTYCENGLQPWSSNKPYPSDVPDSALIIRKHSRATNLFSCLLFNELEGFNPRDQLAFAFVRDHMNPRLRLNMFEVEVFEQVAVEYRHSLKKNGLKSKSGPKTKRPSFGSYGTKCEHYFLKM